MRLFTSLLFVFASLVLQQSAEAFAPAATSFVSKQPALLAKASTTTALSLHDDDSKDFTEKKNGLTVDVTKLVTTTAGIWLSLQSAAFAAGPDWGIFEGRTGSLLHPAMMGSLLLYSLYTGFLGWQWRRQRTLGSDINELKQTLPDLGGASSVKAALEAAKEDEEQSGKIPALEQALETEEKMDSLKAERKELSSQNLKDRHYSQGALLAFLGTAFAIEGPLNTYARAGKLFPGPHLYAGAGLVVLWAMAAACVPAMQKGNDTARSIHIGANAAGIGLFVWQLTSGIPILLKVIEKTSWP